MGIGKFIAWIACLLGGLGSFFQWLGLKPKDLAMTHPMPHILWLLLAVGLFVIGIGSAVWSGIVQRQTIKNLRTQGGSPEIEETHHEEVRKLEVQQKSDLWRAQECYRQCEEEKRAALKRVEEVESQLAIFSPLQIEAFRLARDIRHFLSTLEPIPPIPSTGTDMQRLAALHPKREALTKLDSAYKLKFEDRQRQLELKLGERGISINQPTMGYSSSGNPGAISRYIAAIVAAAHRLDDVIPVDPRTK